MRSLIVLCLTLSCHATVIDVFVDGSFTVPTTDRDMVIDRGIAFEHEYLITITGASGAGVLGYFVDLMATGDLQRPDTEGFASEAVLVDPTRIATFPTGFQGSSPNSCFPATGSECRVPFIFGESFVLRLSGFIQSYYHYSERNHQIYAGKLIETWAHIWIDNEHSVFQDIRGSGLTLVEGAQISVTPLPEPSTAVLSMAGLLLASVLLPMRRK